MNILVTENSIHDALPAADAGGRPLVRIVIVGHVDHGKSTLIGRLLHETGSLPVGKVESLKAFSERRGMPFEWSFLLDALQTERDQGITLDTSQIRFRTAARDIVLIDAPGHAEFLRNMITGASQADAALLLIDAAEGVRDQTRRHGYLLHLLGIHQVAVVINKMDRVDFDEQRFHDIEAEIVNHFSSLGVTATAIIPISARHGDGIAKRTPSIAWHTGPTVLEVLDRFAPARPATELALRIPVQAIYKFDDRRIIAGRVETGRIAVGDEVIIMPRGRKARVQTIEAWPVPDESRVPHEALTGQSVGVTLDDEVFVDRGDIVSAIDAPARSTRRLRARVFWLHESPLSVGDAVTLRVGTAEGRGTVALIDNAVDPGKLTLVEASAIAQNHVGEIEIALTQPIAADVYALNPRTGRVVLEFNGRIAGGGLILATDSFVAPASIDLPALAARLNRELVGLAPAARIARFRQEVDGNIVFTTSFGLEDQVLTHQIAETGADIAIATLDTGRLFPETYNVWAETERRYARRIRAVYPQTEALEALVARQGINGFYDTREARLSCCHVRKVEPLNRALAGAQGWITGLRADQSANRSTVELVSVDVERNLLKLSPLADWTRDAALAYAAANAVPINPLHQKGFVSIGCAPCTRAIAPGESERAGRWWWEEEGKKECGLHVQRTIAAARR
jgi:sulfate adenylyltransferase large subunit/thioredoxin-dependent adenylylsulfate APS reductase